MSCGTGVPVASPSSSCMYLGTYMIMIMDVTSHIGWEPYEAGSGLSSPACPLTGGCEENDDVMG